MLSISQAMLGAWCFRGAAVVVAGILLAMPAQGVPRVLVYTATAGYRHDSIPTAIQTLGNLGPQYNVSFDFTESVWYSMVRGRSSRTEIPPASPTTD